MNLVVFLLSFVVIMVGCEFFTNGVEWMGKRFRLSEGAVGSILAAVGTAMPETLIPLIAILFIGGDAGQEIGTGAILGAPFMLATLALFVCGLSVLVFAKRRQTKTLHINGKLIRRDLRVFLIAYSLAASLIPLYGYYMWLTVQRKDGVCENGDLKCLYFQRVVNRISDSPQERGASVADDVSEAFRKAVYTAEPPTYLIITQVLMGLLAIIVGANMFVQQIESIAEAIGLNPLILALIIAPIATELPEKINSFIWIKERKDTYAIGNITGAMVFQSCFPVTIGVLLTDWHIDISNTVQFLQAVSIGVALLSASVLYWRSSHRELHMSGLMLGGVLYILFLVLVLLSV
jgi:cation:H+ antiporter